MENGERYSRQVLAFGKDGQSRIRQVRVGIVGLGGIGSVVVQMLAYLGVGNYVLVDDDKVEESNLNRLVGATQEDARNKVPKVEVASRLIKTILAGSEVIPLQMDLRNLEALTKLSTLPNYLFGCVDNDGARLILTELSAAYELPLIDCSSGIPPQKSIRPDFGGRVVVAIPGEFCLLCANELDVNEAKQELESPRERADRIAHGYGLGATEPDPAVISLNGLVASLAVTEFIMLVTSMRPPLRKCTYHGLEGIVRPSRDQGRPDCYICKYLVGKKEKAGIERYSRLGLPEDLPS